MTADAFVGDGSGLTNVVGLPGPPGISGLVRATHFEDVPPYEPPDLAHVDAVCPDGKKVLGGGFAGNDPPTVLIVSSFPGSDLEWWRLVVQNMDTRVRRVQAWAVCANVSP